MSGVREVVIQVGGHALGDAVRRFDALEFVALRNEVLSQLRDAIPSVRLVPIPSYYEKPSYGDLDLLICTDNLPPDWRDLARGVLTCRARVDNGPVLSLEHKGLQVDLIAERGDVFAFAFRYYSWNDMGNLIGRIAHRAGFKFGHNGLWYVLREGTRKYADILLTLDFDEALIFLGYNPNRYRQGFNTLEDIFHYVTSTPYFVPHAFPLEGRSHRARVRDAKRPTYQTFLHWIQVHPTITRVMRSREQWLQAAIDRFPHMGVRIAEERLGHARSVAARTRFNGNLVRQWTGLEGRDLGAFMRSFIEQGGECPSKSVEELVEGRTVSEVRRLVLDHYRKLKIEGGLMNDRTENDYYVGWGCNITAASPKEAAEIALRMIVDQKAWAHVFDVTNDHGDTVRVDLDDADDVATGPRSG